MREEELQDWCVCDTTDRAVGGSDWFVAQMPGGNVTSKRAPPSSSERLTCSSPR